MNQTQNINPTPEIVVTTPTINETPEVKKSSKPILGYILFLILGIILGLAGYFAYQNFNSVFSNTEEKQEVNENKNTETTENGNQPPKEEVKELLMVDGKLYYFRDGAKIYEYDYKTDKETTILDLKKTGIRDIKIIDGETLGYSYCDSVTNNLNCKIYTYELKTKKNTLLKTLAKDVLVLDIGFYDKDTFGYLATKGSRWQLIYVDGNESKVLENVKITNGYGRGGYYEDGSALSFNSKGKYLLHLSTSTPRDIEDFNTYAYNLETGTKTKISNSTQSTWLDENKVIYRKIVKKLGEGLYAYDLTTDTSSKLDKASKDSYDPSVLRGTDKVLYRERLSRKLWIYDISDNSSTLFKSDADDGIWIDSNNILWSEIEDCISETENSDECFMTDIKVTSINVTNLETNKTTILKNLDGYNKSSYFNIKH